MVDADTNRVTLAYDKETTYGTAPTGSGIYRLLRYASDSLSQNTATKKSAEIRSDRNVTKVVRTGAEVSGDIVCELSKDAGFEELLQSCLQDTSTWTPITPITTTISITAPSTIADSGSGMGGIAVGDFIILHSCANAANNRPMRVLTATSASLTVDNADLVTEAATAPVLVQGKAIKNEAVAAGSAIDSYSVEREFTDVSSEFAVYRGCTIDGFTISVTADDFVNITFNVMGKDDERPRPTSSKDSGTKIAAGTATQFNAVDDVSAVTENNIEYDVTAFEVIVNNNHHARQVVGTLGPISMGSGTCEVSGSVSLLFSASTQVDKHLAFTETGLDLMLYNGTNDAYVIEIPSLQFTSGDTVSGGQSQDVVAELSWEAQQETTVITGETVKAAIRIWKFL